MADSAAAAPAIRTTHLSIVLGLATGPAVGLGLGRFAYALLLPAMRLDLGWSYAAAGAMNTANAAGYLVGALAAAPIAARFGNRRGFLLGMLLTTASLLANGLSDNYSVLAALRAIAGAAGALSLITGGAVTAQPVEAAGGAARRWRSGCISAVRGSAWWFPRSPFRCWWRISAGAAAGWFSVCWACWRRSGHCPPWHTRRR
jgi:MFS family permease